MSSGSSAIIPFVPVNLKAFAYNEAAKGILYSKMTQVIANVANQLKVMDKIADSYCNMATSCKSMREIGKHFEQMNAIVSIGKVQMVASASDLLKEFRKTHKISVDSGF